MKRMFLALLLTSAVVGCESELRCEDDERKAADQCVRCGRYEEKLRGIYASRNTLFVNATVAGENAIRPIVNYGLATFAQRGSGLVFENKLCAGASQDPQQGDYSPAEGVLSRLDTGDVPVELDCQGGGFSTVREDATVGWSRSLPEGCGAGATSSLFTWDPTTPCVCPSEEGLAAFPTRADDCRLRDEDADQRPGYTVKVTYAIPVFGNVVVDVSQVLALRGYFQGRVDDTGPHDMRWLDTGSELAALQCEISENDGPCLDSQVTYCTGDVNQMVLIPLPGKLEDWNCMRLMTVHDSLFANLSAAPEPTFQMCAAKPEQKRALQ